MERPKANTSAVARMLLTAGCQEGGYARCYLQPVSMRIRAAAPARRKRAKFHGRWAMSRNQVEVKPQQFAAGHHLDEGGSWRGRYRLG